MNTNILFRTNDILVTPAIIRFGTVSYQVAGISSVAVYHRPKFNPFAVTLVVAAVALAVFAYFAREPQPDVSLWSAVAAPVALIAGVAWQRIRPVLEYQFVMKAAGGETETITTFDREQVFALREAVENAFLMQHVSVTQHAQAEQPRPGRVEPELTDDDQAEHGLHITRDWVVANVDLAPR